MTPNVVAEHLTTKTPTCDALGDDPRTDQEGHDSYSIHSGALLTTTQTSKSIGESSNKKQTNTLLDGNIITVGKPRCLPHQCESTQYGLEDVSCSSQHIPADVDLEGEYDDLARPSSTGSASELTILTCRTSEQQCCMEIDPVSRFAGFRRGEIESLSPSMMNCFFILLFFLVSYCPVLC